MMVYKVIPQQYANAELLPKILYWLPSTSSIAKWRCVTVGSFCNLRQSCICCNVSISVLLKRFVSLSAHVQDALETDCSKCSAVQKAGADKVLIFLYKNKPDKFKDVQAKFDPDDSYYKGHEDLFKGDAS